MGHPVYQNEFLPFSCSFRWGFRVSPCPDSIRFLLLLSGPGLAFSGSECRLLSLITEGYGQIVRWWIVCRTQTDGALLNGLSYTDSFILRQLIWVTELGWWKKSNSNTVIPRLTSDPADEWPCRRVTLLTSDPADEWPCWRVTLLTSDHANEFFG